MAARPSGQTTKNKRLEIMKAENLANNQIVISDLTRRAFISYGTTIAQIVMGKTYLDSKY